MKNFLQVLSHLFYTLTLPQPGILTYSCQIVTLHRNQCSSPDYYPAQKKKITKFNSSEEHKKARELRTVTSLETQ